MKIFTYPLIISVTSMKIFTLSLIVIAILLTLINIRVEAIQRKKIKQLESDNREMAYEIQSLRIQLSDFIEL